MKLTEVLNYVNSFEKNPFLKVIDNIISDRPKNIKQIDKILNELDGQLKNADNESVAKVLALIKDEFATLVSKEFTDSTTQLDILIDIIIKDGNSLMSREWLGRLYEKEVKKIKQKIKGFKILLDSENGEGRIRDYKIYSNCLKTAYQNDLEHNLENKITNDEQSILMTLASNLELSHEERKLINYAIVPLKNLDIDSIIKYLSKIGAIFYSKKNYQIYVPDEVVSILRKIRGKEVADKFYRRVLKNLKDSQINLIGRKHNIDRKLSKDQKIKEIINEGISFSSILQNGIHKEGTTKSDKKKIFNTLIEKELKIDVPIRGNTIEGKIHSLIHYFESKEKEDVVGISIAGYENLLKDLKIILPKLNKIVKDEFEFQESEVLNAKFLLNYNIKPLDILYLIEYQDIKKFCEKKEISIRGDEKINILNSYKDSENLLIENYDLIAHRDLLSLKENGILIKEADLGIVFENVTKAILKKLGFNVDDALNKGISNSKNKVDIILNLGENEIIIIECKSKKEKGYNNFSTVSRQVKSYIELAQKNEYKVIKAFIIAPDFTDEFVKDCGLEYELNLSLITSNSIKKIYEEFKNSKLSTFPYKLLLRDVLVNDDRIVRAYSTEQQIFLI